MTNVDFRHLAGFCLVLTAFFVAGCNTSPSSEQPTGPQVASTTATGPGAAQTSTTFTRFPDMPVPVESEFDLERTLVFGSEDAWFGRMVILTQYSPDDMFDFYQAQLPAFGWRQITAVRAAVTILTVGRRDRIATLQIQGTQQLGTEVSITVSPRGTPIGGAVAPSSMPGEVPAGHGSDDAMAPSP